MAGLFTKRDVNERQLVTKVCVVRLFRKLST
jgi:hypothetical protein